MPLDYLLVSQRNSDFKEYHILKQNINKNIELTNIGQRKPRLVFSLQEQRSVKWLERGSVLIFLR